jgi:hypothetical protein
MLHEHMRCDHSITLSAEEIVGDSIAEAVPVLGNHVFQEFQDCPLELAESFVVPVMGRGWCMTGTLFDRIEMGTMWRDKVQHGVSVLLFWPVTRTMSA